MKIIKNKPINTVIFILISVFTTISCESTTQKYVDNRLVNTGDILYKTLQNTSKNGFCVGHQDTFAYGTTWVYGKDVDSLRSDIHDIVNDYPSVFGFDIGHLELGKSTNLDGVSFDHMREFIQTAHQMGGIITISWHPDHPVTEGNTWDQTPAVKSILPNGAQRSKYELWVNRLATFFNSLEIEGEKVPVIFRPFHEMNGSWFWWGNPNSSTEDYILLYKDLVHQLRDKHEVHNLLYAYSPNKLNPEDEYMNHYPGDDYVDVFGIDIYDFDNAQDYQNSILNDFAIMKKEATKRQKLFAFTETGNESLDQEKWFTDILYPAIKDSGIAWVLFWRNSHNIEGHHYMAFPGHPIEDDFVKFYQKPETLFLNDFKIISNN